MKSAGDRLLGNSGTFRCVFRSFRSTFRFNLRLEVKTFRGNFALQRCHPNSMTRMKNAAVEDFAISDALENRNVTDDVEVPCHSLARVAFQWRKGASRRPTSHHMSDNWTLLTRTNQTDMSYYGRLIFYHYWCWRAGGAAPVKTSTGNIFPRKYQRIPRNYYQYWC